MTKHGVHIRAVACMEDAGSRVWFASPSNAHYPLMTPGLESQCLLRPGWSADIEHAFKRKVWPGTAS